MKEDSKNFTDEQKIEIIHTLIDKVDFLLDELMFLGEEHLDIEMYLLYLKKAFKHKKRRQ
jgi:hypothetical protein